MTHRNRYVSQIVLFRAGGDPVNHKWSDLRPNDDRLDKRSPVRASIGRDSAPNVTASATCWLPRLEIIVGVDVCGSTPYITTVSLTIFADRLGLSAQRLASTTVVSELAFLARLEKAPHAAPLYGALSPEEACRLACVVGAERPADTGFTTTRTLHGCGAPEAYAPLTSTSFWTIDSVAIHLPPSRALPRATPGFAGCAERGWRRTPLGTKSAVTRPTLYAAERRPSPPGVARGLASATTAAAISRHARGRAWLLFARLGARSWPGAALGRRVPATC